MKATQVNPLAYDAAVAIHQAKKAVQHQGAPNLADANDIINHSFVRSSRMLA